MADAYAKTDEADKEADDDTAVVRAKRKDEKKSKKTIEQLKRWVDEAMNATRDSRGLSERDRDYHDGNQLSESTLNKMRERGQPPVVINKIAKKVNTILGSAERNRTEPEALPTKPSEDEAANAMTDALRFVSDMVDQPSVETDCMANFVVEGTCAVYIGVDIKKSMKPIASETNVIPIQRGTAVDEVDADEAEEEASPTVEWIPWDRFIYDPRARRLDFKDAKYLGLDTWYDLEDAIDRWPGAEDVLREAVENGDGDMWDDTRDDTPRANWVELDANRQRLRVTELYWEERGEWYGAKFVYCGFVEEPDLTGLLNQDGKNECPVEGASCFITRDNDRYGQVRVLIDPQDEVNKRRSKSLDLLARNQVFAEKGALLDIKATQAQASRPDGVVIFEDDALSQGRAVIKNGIELAQAQLGMYQMAVSEIDGVGPDLPNAAADDSAQSGRARIAQQQFASLEQERANTIFRRFRERIERQKMNRIRQFWNYEKWCRVRDDKQKSGYRFVALNRRVTKLDRVAELVTEKNVPFASAATMVGDTEFADQAAQLYAMALQNTQQQAQAAQQHGAQVTQQQIEKMAATQALMMCKQLPQAEDIVIANQISALNYDIKLGEAPDTAVIRQEQFETIADLMMKGVPIPPWFLIEESSLRNKQDIIEALKQATQGGGPDPAQQQAAAQANALQSQLVQAETKKTLAQADQASADAQAKLAGIGHTQAKAQNLAVQTQIEAQHAPIKAHKDVIDAEHTRVLTESERQGMVRTHADILRSAAEANQPQEPGQPQPPR
jgi:hypothetical protein